MYRGDQLRFVVLLVCVLVPIGIGVGVVAATDDPTIEEYSVVELNEETPGEVSVTTGFELPSGVTDFTIVAPDDGMVAVTSTTNLRETSDGYVWTGTGTPRLTYSLSVPEDRVDGDAYGVDTGEWAVVRPHSFESNWNYLGREPVYERTITAAGSGVAGGTYVLLGEYTKTTENVDGRDVTIASPGSESSISDIEAIFDRYRVTNEHVWMRQDYQSTLGIAIPSEYRDGGHSGQAVGNDFYALTSDDDLTVSTIWIHEYVHTGQRASLNEEMMWFTEATAMYYTSMVQYNTGELSYSEFDRTVRTGRYSDAILTDQSTWDNKFVQYEKGQYILAALDAEIQAETDGEKTLADIYRVVQESDEELTYSDFQRILLDVSGSETVQWADEYIDSAGVPELERDPAVYEFPGVDIDDAELSDRDTRAESVESASGFEHQAACVFEDSGNAVRDGLRTGVFEVSIFSVLDREMMSFQLIC